MAKNAAEKQGMATNVTYVQNQNADLVLNSVRTLADVHAKSGIRLVVACAQFMLVRAYHMNDQERWDVTRSRDFLRTQLGYQGLKTSSSYRYIQTGLEFARGLMSRHGMGGIMADFFTAKDERKAFDVLERACVEHAYLKSGVTGPLKDWPKDAEGKHRLSMDVLQINLGMVKLEPPKAAPTVDASNPAASLGVTAPADTGPKATKANPKSIIARLKADKDLLKAIPSEVIVGAADVIGRERMAERLVSLMSLDECIQLQSAIVARMKALETPEAQKAETKAETAEQAEPAEQTEQPTRRKSSPRNRKAA